MCQDQRDNAGNSRDQRSEGSVKKKLKKSVKISPSAQELTTGRKRNNRKRSVNRIENDLILERYKIYIFFFNRH